MVRYGKRKKFIRMIRVHAGPERNIRNAAGRTNLFFYAEQRDQLTKQGREPLTEVKDEITQILVIGSICLYDDGDAFRISQKEREEWTSFLGNQLLHLYGPGDLQWTSVDHTEEKTGSGNGRAE